MAGATTLPDDFVLEYDLLHLVDELPSSGSANSTASTLDVDDLLGSGFMGLDAFVDAPECLAHHRSSSCHAAAAVTATASLAKELEADSLLNVTAGFGLAHAADDELSEFIINGEAFLTEMEKVVTMDAAAGDDDSFLHMHTPSSPESSGSGGFQDDLDGDAFTDADVLSSPCPSSCECSTPMQAQDELQGSFFEGPSMWGDAQQQQQQHAAAEDQLLLQHQQLLMMMPPPEQPSQPFPGMGFSHNTLHTQQQQQQQQFHHQQQPIDLTTVEDEADEDIDVDDVKGTNDAELLQKEAKYLEAQYDYLVSRAKSSRPPRASIKGKRGRQGEKSALVKSSQDRQILTELVTQQQVYLDNFKAMLAFAPVNDLRLALMTPMESYIHLGRDFDERRRTILSLREEKLDMTLKYIEQKAQGLSLDQPYQYSDMFEKFGKNYCVNFAISRYDDVSVLAVAGAIYEQIAGKDEDITSKMGCLTVRESYDQIRCNFMHQRIVSSMRWDDDAAGAMPDVESNAIFYSRIDNHSAVMATDYIDQDDLHPYQGSERIRKDVSSGVVLTGHVDAEGKPYVIMKRFLMAKFHMFPHKIPQEQQDRFFSKMPHCNDKMRTLIVDKLARKDESGTYMCTVVEQQSG
ncbi:hypothetical protein PybrP1_003479 [[Pythium] brassicae (nom. inval.)]|nr:hypothetical protein PybrP1_003479 [[Pythium] brassicae (nom. inval.)]